MWNKKGFMYITGNYYIIWCIVLTWYLRRTCWGSSSTPGFSRSWTSAALYNSVFQSTTKSKINPNWIKLESNIIKIIQLLYSNWIKSDPKLDQNLNLIGTKWEQNLNTIGKSWNKIETKLKQKWNNIETKSKQNWI